MSFTEARYEAAEGDEVINLCVNLSAPFQAAVEIHLETIGYSATEGSDFLNLDTTFTFVEEGVMCVNVTLVDDNALEDDELLLASLSSNSDLPVNITTPTVDVVILDSDRK